MNRSRHVSVALVVLVTVVATVAPAVGATPPPPPAAYYGDLTIDGTPAPAGTVLTAEVDGEVRGRLVTEQAGSYGGPGAFDPKLQVDGTADDEGATVVLFVDGQPAGTTTWRSADVRQVDLDASATGGGGDPSTPTATPTPTPTPVPPEPSTPTPTPGGGGGDGGDGGDGDAPATPVIDTPVGPPDDVPPDGEDGPEARPTVDIERDADGRVRVTVLGAAPGAPVPVPVGPGPGDDGASLDRLSVTSRPGGDFTLDVVTGAAPPAGTPPFDVPGTDPPIGYFEVDHSLPDADIGPVRFTFRVPRARLDALDRDPGSVSLYRYHDGRWGAVRAADVRADDDDIVYEAVSPGLSTFAVATRAPAGVRVAEATLLTEQVAAGNLGAVTVVVENPTDETVEATLVLHVDGTAVSGRTVTVPADGRAETTLTHRFDAPGEYTLAVGDASVGTVTVSGSAPTTSPTLADASTTERGDPATTDVTGAGGPGFGVLPMLGALLVTALWMARRRRPGRPRP